MITILRNDCISTLHSIQSATVDCIYSDILFNTHTNLGDFNDNLGTPQQAILWYRDIFIEMRRVLKDTGVLYIHCDSNLSHYVKVELDSIFGMNNFRNEIIWYYNSAPRRKKDFGRRHDTILRYSKTENYYFNADSSYIRQEYSKTAPRGYEKEKYYSPKGKIRDDVWQIGILGQNDKTERCGYATQKPKKLLYPIIDSSCPKNGTFADFFCGSGTSLVVAQELGISNIIGCDISNRAVQITRGRLGLQEDINNE